MPPKHPIGFTRIGKKRGRSEGPAAAKGDAFDEKTGALLGPRLLFGPDGESYPVEDDDHKIFDKDEEGPDGKKRKTSGMPEGPTYGKNEHCNKHPLLKPQISLIIGPTGSGKSQLSMGLIYKILDAVDPAKLGKIYYYTGSPMDAVGKALDVRTEFAAHIAKYGPDDVQALLDDLRRHRMDARDIINEGAESCDEGPKDGRGKKRKKGGGSETQLPLSLLVLDDAGQCKDLMPTQVKGGEIVDIFTSHRHLGIHVIVMAQRYTMINIFLRDNASQIFLFPGKSEDENKKILSETPLPDDVLLRELRCAGAQKFQFLWINMPERKAFMGFDKAVVK